MAKRPRRVRLVCVEGRRIARLPPRTLTRRSVNPHHVVNRDPFSFRGRGVTDPAPVLRRDALPALPLNDSPVALIDRLSQFGESRPDPKNVLDGLQSGSGSIHEPLMPRDYSSRQGGTTRPVHAKRATGTLSPMGRGVTPQEFVDIFCGRVDALVEASGRSNVELASAMGVEVDTFRRYRKRLLMPHHLIPRFCEVMGIEPKFLFTTPPTFIEAHVVKETKRIPAPARRNSRQ